MTALFDEDDLPEISKPHPNPVMMRPDEILSLKRAMFFAQRSDRTMREWGEIHGISRQSGPNGKLEFSAPAIQMVLQGRFDILERFRKGDRHSRDIREFFDLYGIPGPELLPDHLATAEKPRPANCRRAPIQPHRPLCDVDSDQMQDGEMDIGFDENGNDRTVSLMLSGGNVLQSFRTDLVMAANKAGMTVNEFTLRAVGRQLVESGSDILGVFQPGDIKEDR